jgi:hypothetical protein
MSQENVEVVRRAYAAFNRGDLASAVGGRVQPSSLQPVSRDTERAMSQENVGGL